MSEKSTAAPAIDANDYAKERKVAPAQIIMKATKANERCQSRPFFLTEIKTGAPGEAAVPRHVPGAVPASAHFLPSLSISLSRRLWNSHRPS
ncbi:hypothetical protein [Aureimonas altamirensis]|uniref:hypothetical protein n=1 Tax=Aureimonas altamirensis TaxID=370622 RepID=UPI00203681A6|nr:hypothetical protein [Aureimonas altamirensis]